MNGKDKQMRFFCFKTDFEIPVIRPNNKSLTLDESTSVTRQKEHFFECIRSFGEIVFLDKIFDHQELTSLFNKPNHIFFMVHGGDFPPSWNMIPKRILQHSLGDYSLPVQLYNALIFPDNKINLVTSDFQAKRLKKYLKKAAPRMAVFTPKQDEEVYYPPTKKERSAAREDLGISEKEVHIVYAGRWVATKGICQLIRVLNLWPLKDVTITLVGNFNPQFTISQMNATHLTFESYFERQFLQNYRDKRIRLLKPQFGKSLRKIFWSADVFVYPSVQEDENFGMTPREAALCGLPVVVTDFCGLHPLAVQMPWRGIPTYPTFLGPRYSLNQFRNLITRALKREEGTFRDYSISVKEECDPSVSKANLRKAIMHLLRMPLKKLPDMRTAEKQAKIKLMKYADKKIVRPFIRMEENIPEGAFVDGLGVYTGSFPYNGLFQALQGIYTTIDETFIVETGNTFRGFFPIVLWKEMTALVEFGFPGPRMRRYNSREWNSLLSCAKVESTSEITLCPTRKDEIKLAQELVNLGYIVPDFY